MTLPGRGAGNGRAASGDAHAGAHRDAVPLHRLLGRARPRDRKRLLQLYRAEHPGRPSGSCHARYLLYRRETCAAHAHLADPDPLHAEARGTIRASGIDAGHPHHRAGPCLPGRFGCHPFADVPSGGRPVDRGTGELRRSERSGAGFPAALSSSAKSCRCVSVLRSFRSPNRRPRWT